MLKAYEDKWKTSANEIKANHRPSWTPTVGVYF